MDLNLSNLPWEDTNFHELLLLLDPTIQDTLRWGLVLVCPQKSILSVFEVYLKDSERYHFWIKHMQKKIIVTSPFTL